MSASFWLAAPFDAVQCREADSRGCLITIIHGPGEFSVELSPGEFAGKRWPGMAIHMNDVHAFVMLGVRGRETVSFTSRGVIRPDDIQPRRVAGQIAARAVGRVI